MWRVCIYALGIFLGEWSFLNVHQQVENPSFGVPVSVLHVSQADSINYRVPGANESGRGWVSRSWGQGC